MRSRGETGSAAIEAVLVTPVILVLLALLIAGGRLTTDRAALRGVAREAGRIAVTASNPAEAVSLAEGRAVETASSYGLDPGAIQVTVDPGTFERGTEVVVTATYSADLSALPSFGLIPDSARLAVRHVEPIDRYISR